LRHFSRPRRRLLLALCGFLSGCTAVPHAQSLDLTLRLDSHVCWVADTQVLVPFALQNLSGSSVRLSQYPGIALWASCVTASGERKSAIVPGLLIPALPLPDFQRYSLVLPPGAALYGSAPVWVSEACAAQITVEGQYVAFGPDTGPPGSPAPAHIVAGLDVRPSSPLVLERPFGAQPCPAVPPIF
jgi:hypothetical protein